MTFHSRIRLQGQSHKCQMWDDTNQSTPEISNMGCKHDYEKCQSTQSYMYMYMYITSKRCWAIAHDLSSLGSETSLFPGNQILHIWYIHCTCIGVLEATTWNVTDAGTHNDNVHAHAHTHKQKSISMYYVHCTCTCTCMYSLGTFPSD